MLAGSAYLLALLVVHGFAPRLQPARIESVAIGGQSDTSKLMR